MNIEKVIEIKINDITYIVSKVNRNDDYLKEVTAGLLVRAVTSFHLRFYRYDDETAGRDAAGIPTLKNKR